MYYDCIIAGFGGQGVLLMGNILAYAGMMEDKNVTFMPVYGVEMRGGTANCTVAVSDDPIGSPVIQNPVSSIVMNLPSLEKFAPRVQKDGFLMVNGTLITEEELAPYSELDSLRVPSRDLALEAGNARLANMVMLGAAIQKSGVVSLSVMESALVKGLAPKYHKMIPGNLAAIEAGAKFVANA